MKNFKSVRVGRLALGLFWLLGSANLIAAPFAILGSRALGLGGAFVAVVGQSPGTSDALIQYWNPAALGLHPGFDIELPVVAGVEATGGILNSAKAISDLSARFDEINQAQKDGTYITLEDLKAFSQAVKNLDSLNAAGMGLTATAGAGVNTSVGKWAVSVNNFNYIGVDPNVDISSLYLGSATLTSGSIQRAISLASGDYSGIDLSKIPNINTSAPSDQELQSASNDLATVIGDLSSKAGLNLGGYSAEQIANALINYAKSQGISNSDIVSSVQTIKDIRPLLDKFLSGNLKVFSDNKSNITIRGVSLTELAVGYGRDCSFIFPALNNLYLGGNVKYLYGIVGYLKQSVWDEGLTTSGTLFQNFTKNYKASGSLALDLGLLYDLKEKYRTRVGIIGKNINQPQFSQPEAAISDGLSDKYTLDSQWRAGVAVWPLNWILVAADYDLTENKTTVEGYNSRLFGMGAELNAFNRNWLNIALRAGILKNMANSQAPLTYTAGLGLNLVHFVLDLSGAMSAEQVLIENGTSIPSSAYLMLSLGFNF